MNITDYQESFLEKATQSFDKQTSATRLGLVNGKTDTAQKASAEAKDDLVNQFWNLTDSLPREDQLSFAAAVIANRVMEQGMTEENSSFLQNVGDRFSASEIGEIKDQVLSIRKSQNEDVSGVDALFGKLQNALSAEGNAAEEDNMEALGISPLKISPDEIYFRSALLGSMGTSADSAAL